MKRSLFAAPAALLALIASASAGRIRTAVPPTCPEVMGVPCAGHGSCDKKSAVCWCDTGFGGTDCNTEVPLYYDVTAIGPPELQDMLGRYKVSGMYLLEVTDPYSGYGREPPASQVKFIHYDTNAGGWMVSMFNSTCVDDSCFFAYGKDQPVPPSKGYVYGNPDMHVYYKQLIFDDAEMDAESHNKRGYHLTLSYTPDPNVVGVPALSSYNGRYALVPRYTHMENGKYSIYPIDLKNPGRLWVVTGLFGDALQPRKRKIIMNCEDPSSNRYMVPQGPWKPDYGFKIKAACANHVGNMACTQLENQCTMVTPDTTWIRACCRDTCQSCSTPRSECKLPKVNTKLAAIMLARKLKKASQAQALPGSTPSQV